MPPIKHARLSASSAHRWIECPGSVALSEKFPPQPSTKYTEEGSAAHELAELKLRSFTEDKWKPQIEQFKSMDEYYCGEMDEATSFYAETVIQKLLEEGEDAELLVEQRFSLSDWVPESFGTSDAVIIGNDTITVIDLKYGQGVKVDAVSNPQLRLYGLGAANLFSDLYDFKTVRTMIIQPRLGHVSVEEMPLKELLLWAEDVVVPRARMAMDNTTYTAAGEWCRWCQAKAACRTRAEKNLELAVEDFEGSLQVPGLLSEEEIGKILTRGDELKKWIEDAKEYALQQAQDGKRIDGWKVVERRSVRKYADEAKVVSALKAAGIPEAMLYERKLNGITAMEKVVGKKKLTEILGDLIEKPAGKPTLVPVSDKRAEMTATASAAEDFKGENDE